MHLWSAIKSLFFFGENNGHDAAEKREPALDTDVIQNGLLYRETTGSVLFLDFDGVAHAYEHGTLEHLPAFEELMQRHPEIDVVISSDWRLTLNKKGLLELFSKDFRGRIVGTTPDLGSIKRHPEVLRFVADYNIHKWIAVDDRADLFPPSCEYLFLTDKSVGLNKEWILKLESRLEAL
jgi:hypothetical protein